MLGLQKPPAQKLQTLKTTVASARQSPVGTAAIVMINVQTMQRKAQKNVRIPKSQE